MPDKLIPAPRPVQGEVITDYDAHRAKKSALELLDFVSLVMDRLFVVPGTKVRFGVNSFLLVLPIIGDFIPSLVSFAILAIGLSHYRVPRIVAVRMMLNSLLDAGIGWIPLLGDLFDLYFKADTRNVRLLQQYAANPETTPSTWRHWAFVIGLVGLFALVTLLIILGTIALMAWLVHLIRGEAPAAS